MKSFTDPLRSNQYSQNGEDGVIREIVKRLGIHPGRIVEFGAADGIWCSNARLLYELGWSGTMIEPDAAKFNELIQNTMGLPLVQAVHGMITPENVNELVGDTDVLSIDVDGNDYKIWNAYKGNAKVVIIEVNSSFHPDVMITGNKGTSYKMMVKLGLKKGYFVFSHIGNIIFIKNEYKDLFPEIVTDPIEHPEDYFDYGWINGKY